MLGNSEESGATALWNRVFTIRRLDRSRFAPIFSDHVCRIVYPIFESQRRPRFLLRVLISFSIQSLLQSAPTAKFLIPFSSLWLQQG
jgi:hypothetical protein